MSSSNGYGGNLLIFKWTNVFFDIIGLQENRIIGPGCSGPGYSKVLQRLFKNRFCLYIIFDFITIEISFKVRQKIKLLEKTNPKALSRISLSFWRPLIRKNPEGHGL